MVITVGNVQLKLVELGKAKRMSFWKLESLIINGLESKVQKACIEDWFEEYKLWGEPIFVQPDKTWKTKVILDVVTEDGIVVRELEVPAYGKTPTRRPVVDDLFAEDLIVQQSMQTRFITLTDLLAIDIEEALKRFVDDLMNNRPAQSYQLRRSYMVEHELFEPTEITEIRGEMLVYEIRAMSRSVPFLPLLVHLLSKQIAYSLVGTLAVDSAGLGILH